MIKLFSLKQQSKDGLNPQSSKKTSAAYLRVQKGTIILHVSYPYIYQIVDIATIIIFCFSLALV